jgi:hypothetical protein
MYAIGSKPMRRRLRSLPAKEAADSLAGVDVPVWFPMKKPARRQRLSVRVGAMVAELSF